MAEGQVTPSTENLNFDDDTLKGKNKETAHNFIK